MTSPANPYMEAFEQFSSMMPPDPNTFLKLLWPHLDINTRGLVKALLSNPASAMAPAPSAAATEGLSGFDKATGKVRLSPTDPDATRLLKERPNEYVMTPASQAAPELAKLAVQAAGGKPVAAPSGNTVKASGLQDVMRNTGMSQEEALKKLGGASVELDIF